MNSRLKNSFSSDKLWGTFLFILFLPITLLILGLFSILDLFNRKHANTFYQKNINRFFFFYGNKKGLEKFSMDVIIPVLPEGTIIYNINRDKKSPIYLIYIIAEKFSSRGNETVIPFIIKLSHPCPIILSLRKDFIDFRKSSTNVNLIQMNFKNKIDDTFNI